MRILRGFIPTTIIAAVLMFGTTFANAGIIVQGFDGTPTKTEQCTEPVETKMDWGIIVQGLTGIIVQGLTGIIVQGVLADEPVECGIIVQG